VKPMKDLTPQQLAETIVRGLHENWQRLSHLRGAKKKRAAVRARPTRTTRSKKSRSG